LDNKIIHWTINALDQLAELYDYIADDSVKSAQKYVNGLYESTERLSRFPESCAPCRHDTLREAGYRCCKYRNHIVVYKLSEYAVTIHAVIHSRRNPDVFGELVG